MNRFSLKNLTDGAVLHGLKSHLARERDALADVLAHIAEVDERKLYVPAGYESMHDYCMRELHLSKDSTNKRIHAARAALGFPEILERVAEGALGLSAVNALAPYLTAENAAELLAAAALKPRDEVRKLLAEWFPQEAVPTTIEPIAQPMTLAVIQAEGGTEFVVAPAPLHGVVRPQIEPLAADRYLLTLTMSAAMRAKLLRAAELFGRRKPVPDEAEILELGLDLVLRNLEKKKCGATDRPQAARRSTSPRHVSNEVKRDVWARDEGQCTFKSDDGTRCMARKDLECDHIVPVAKGGTSEASNVRLRCRTHNQYEAERVYGRSFMQNKRDQAQAAAAKRKAEKAAKQAAREALDHDELMPGLRGLGFTKEEARFALAKCAPMGELPIETRLKKCLAVLAPPHRRVPASSPADHGTTVHDDGQAYGATGTSE